MDTIALEGDFEKKGIVRKWTILNRLISNLIPNIHRFVNESTSF